MLVDEHFVEDLSAAFAFVFGLAFGGGGRFGLGLNRSHGVTSSWLWVKELDVSVYPTADECNPPADGFQSKFV
jgi:hypothetical protein